MNAIKSIRDKLNLTQSALAEGLGCTQGNVWQYEQGQTVPPSAAKRLIAFAKTKGLDITYEQIYAEGAELEQAQASIMQPVVQTVVPVSDEVAVNPAAPSSAYGKRPEYVADMEAGIVTDERVAKEARRKVDRDNATPDRRG